jgi:hypothetical protein
MLIWAILSTPSLRQRRFLCAMGQWRKLASICRPMGFMVSSSDWPSSAKSRVSDARSFDRYLQIQMYGDYLMHPFHKVPNI